MEANLQEENPNYPPLGVSGLGGWLILVQIGIYLSILLLLVQIFQNILPVFTNGSWEALTSKQSELYHPLWGPVIIGEMVYNIALLILTVFILIHFYGRKKILPKLMIILYSASLIGGIIDYALLYQIPMAREYEDGSAMRDIMKAAGTCAIWIPYFLKSDRVFNTFRR